MPLVYICICIYIYIYVFEDETVVSWVVLSSLRSDSNNLSFKVKKLAYFLSHDWDTLPRRKIWSLLILFNASGAAIVTVIFAMILGLALYAELLPNETWVYLLPYVSWCQGLFESFTVLMVGFCHTLG